MHDKTSVLPVTNDMFEALIKEKEIVFVDFWAEWCAPCKSFTPIYQKVAAENPTIVFGSVDVANESALSDVFQIRSIPHLMVFKQGIAIYSESGSMPESTLQELVQQAVAVDVSAILAGITDAQEAVGNSTGDDS